MVRRRHLAPEIGAVGIRGIVSLYLVRLTFCGGLRVYGVIAESNGGIIEGKEALLLLHSQGTTNSIVICS